MRIGDRDIAPDGPPYVIAELGVNHDGCGDKARALVDAAVRAEADAIKLQFFRARALVSRSARLAAYQASTGVANPFELLEKLELSADDLHGLARAARRAGCHAIVSVFSVELVDQLDPNAWDAFKVASPDLVNRPLIEALVNRDRPLILSTGAATLEEIRRTLGWLGDYPHLLMQCVSAYPTPDEHAALGGIRALQALDPAALGYSDHTEALDTGALAVAAGARLLEKHLTYDRNAPGPDHAASLDPAGLCAYVRLAHRAARMVGGPVKLVQEIERDVRRTCRQYVVAARPLAAGETLQAGAVTIKRASATPGGAESWRLRELLGRTLRRDVEADAPIAEKDLA